MYKLNSKRLLAALIFCAVLVILYLVDPKSFEPTNNFDKSIKLKYGQQIKVDHVIDGDTIVLVNGETLRYVGIDTPEEFDERKPVQCFAIEAAAKNKELVEGKLVTIQKDVSTKDRYGRWLGFVYLEDGTFINMKMVADGFAFSYPFPPDISKAIEFSAAEKTAREKKLGLWSGCSVYQTSGGREQTNGIE